MTLELDPIRQLIATHRNELISWWLDYFPEEEHETEKRYYADFLSFFDECFASQLDPNSDEALALSTFMKKLAEIKGDDFYRFRNSVYTYYLKFPIYRLLDREGLFHFEVVGKMTAFFESLTSRLIFETLVRKNEVLRVSETELAEREAPISEVWEGALLVSIVGTLDSHRVITIIDKVLTAIEQYDSRMVIIDIGAIFDINTEVANQIRKLCSAIAFMGAEAQLVGIKKNIAKAMSHLDISIGEIKTFRSARLALEAIVGRELR